MNADDAFWTTYRHHAERLVGDVAAAASGSPHRELSALDVIAATATSHPDVAALLMREGLAAGPAGRYERDGLISSIERAMTGSGWRRSAIDLPPSILIGATFRFLSMRLSDGGSLDGLGDALREWANVFAERSSRPSWSARLAPSLTQRASRPQVYSGGTRLVGTPRERMIRATAATVCKRGFRDVTVTDIVEHAGVSRRGFYNEFLGKSGAFIATYEYGFQQCLAACAPAFFASEAWRERVWHGAEAFRRFLLREPLIGYLGVGECYSAGPGFARRVRETQLAFTLFLEEGYRQRPEAQLLSRACSALTTAAIFEAAFCGLRGGPSASVRRMQPLAAYIALAPFIGRDAAGEFVAGKVSEQARTASAAG
jgi:AcrR family transcriptional regulator